MEHSLSICFYISSIWLKSALLILSAHNFQAALIFLTAYQKRAFGSILFSTYFHLSTASRELRAATSDLASSIQLEIF